MNDRMNITEIFDFFLNSEEKKLGESGNRDSISIIHQNQICHWEISSDENVVEWMTTQSTLEWITVISGNSL